MSLMGSTIGSFGIKHPFLCNGANLCYHKKAFFEVEGFKDNDTIASGDDIFFNAKNDKSIFVKSALPKIIGSNSNYQIRSFLEIIYQSTTKMGFKIYRL